MGKTSKPWLTALALVAVASLLLACDSTPIPPAPNQQQNTPTPLPPPQTAEEVFARAKQVFAAETAHSYAITETDLLSTTATPLDKPDPTIPLYSWRFDYSEWFQSPSQWRTEAHTTSTYPFYPGQMFLPSPPILLPEDGTEVSDGRSYWQSSATGDQVIVWPSHGITPINAPHNPRETAHVANGVVERTRDLLQYISDCYTATLKPNDVVAGRAAYVIALATKCPNIGIPNLSTSRTVWLDKQTYLLLKDEASSENPRGSSLVQTTAITATFNSVIDPSTFAFTPMPGARISDNRPLPNGVSEARQLVSFPVFVPTYLPSGTVAEPVYFRKDDPNQIVLIHYHSLANPYILTVSDSPALTPSLLTRSVDEQVTLHSGQPAYFSHLLDDCLRRQTFLSWNQSGTYVSLWGSEPGFGAELSNDELIKIAASMSQTAVLDKTEWLPATAVPWTLATPTPVTCFTPHP